MVFKRRVDGDGLGRLLLVSSIQESLRDNEIRSVSDLASSARRFKYCQYVWLGPTRRCPPQALGLTAGQLRLDARHYRSDFLSRSGYFTASMRDLSR